MCASPASRARRSDVHASWPDTRPAIPDAAARPEVIQSAEEPDERRQIRTVAESAADQFPWPAETAPRIVNAWRPSASAPR